MLRKPFGAQQAILFLTRGGWAVPFFWLGGGGRVIGDGAQPCWAATGLCCGSRCFPPRPTRATPSPPNGSPGGEKRGCTWGAERAQAPSLKNLNSYLQKKVVTWETEGRGISRGCGMSRALSLAGGRMQQLQQIEGLHVKTHCLAASSCQ